MYKENNSSELNFQSNDFMNNTIILFYSSNGDLYEFIKSYPNLIFIKLKECQNILMEKYNFKEESDLILIEMISLDDSKNYILNNFTYDIYTRNGERISNLSSICENIYIELSLPINRKLKNYEEAIIFAEQGYDIYNLSSEFYTDICLSASINESDLTLSLRQNEIYPNETLCYDGCIYNGIDLENNRINCSCHVNFSNNYKNNENFFEVVEQNFFTYIASMINYKIISCIKIIFDKKAYINNYGFYISGFLFFLIITSIFIYHIIGKKYIRIKYYRNSPNIINLNLKIK